MAKIKKRNLDSVKRAPARRQSYESPSLYNRNKQVPKEYQTLQKAKKGKGSCVWFLFLIFLATLAGLWYFSQEQQEQTNNSIELSVEGPDKIVSGDQVTYKVKYKNVDIVSMQQMELSIRWPNGFYFDKATLEPIDQNATTWLLEDLAPNQTVEFEIYGQLVGSKDEEMSSSFILSYQPENFHSNFKARANVDTKITDAKIEVGIEAIDKILVATEQEIKINFKNLTDETLNDLYIDILYPDDFQIVNNEESEEDVEEEPEFITEGDYLKFSLEGQAVKTMTIHGMFTVDSKTDQLLVVEVGNMADEKFRRLARVEKQIVVANPKFDMDFQINGQRGSQNINWSDTLRYQLEITNSSESDISDVVISAVMDSLALDWDSIDTVGSFSDGKITWTKEQDEALSLWPAGESRTFTWQINVVSNPQPDRMVENIIQINIEGLEDWQQVSSPVMLTIGESISFNNGVYWDLAGRRVGSGLLPPQVGEETEYLVIWSLPQATGSFDSVSVTTNLPPDVDFISETDVQGGNLEFDLAERSLTWSMDNFSDLILPITASFLVSITPNEASRGQAATILNATTVNASGMEDVIVRSKAISTSDVISNNSGPIGIIE